LRPLAQSHPKVVYGILMKAAADAVQKLAADPRFLGARPGILAVLHTWTRAMLYHPHVHMLVTAGGLAFDSSRWVQPKNPKFLVPVKALSVIFAAKVCTALKKADLLKSIPPDVWKKPWVVHCQHAGSGQKVLDYLGRYVFRIALTNNRLEQIQDGKVTFHYRDNRTQLIRRITLSGIEFLCRFLQHVLPRGCTKVRHYGLFSPHCRTKLDSARSFITLPDAIPTTVSTSLETPNMAADPGYETCPFCRVGKLRLIDMLPRQRSRSP
jgi:hypothetical protein